MRLNCPRTRTMPLLTAWACAWALNAVAQVPTNPSGSPATSAVGNPNAVPTPAALTRPNWSELTASEQQALAPLKTHWPSISPAQKRKWQAIAKNFTSLSSDEQAKLHARVQEWAQLSPQQRAQARLNFAESTQHTPDQKRSKWEAYQALTSEERNKLAAASPTTHTGTATAVKKVPSHKLAASPALKAPHLTGPKIDVEMLDPSTLLPQAPQTASAPSAPTQSE